MSLALLAHGTCATISVDCDRFCLGKLVHRGIGVKLTYTPDQSQQLFPDSDVLMFCFGSAGILSDHLPECAEREQTPRPSVLASASKMKIMVKTGGTDLLFINMTKASPRSWVILHLLPFSVS